MQKRTRNILVLCAAIAALSSQQVSQGAVSVANWDFETGWTAAQSVNINGTGSSYISGTPTLAAAGIDSKWTVQQGTGTGTDTTKVMEFSGGNPGHDGTGNNFILKLTAATALSGFHIAYDAMITSGGQATSTRAYSLNSGGAWTTLGTTETATTSWNNFSVDFSGAGTVAANGIIWFRDTLSGAGTIPATASFDNFNVTAVPEPINAALGIFAGVFLLIILARSRPVRNRVHRWRVAAVRWVDAV